MAYSEENREVKEEIWYIDSGCNNHIERTKEWFFDFDDKFREFARHGSDSKMVVMGRGNVKLCFKGRIHVIIVMYYIPKLRNNLLSVAQLQQRNITIVLKNNVCQLFHGENEVDYNN